MALDNVIQFPIQKEHISMDELNNMVDDILFYAEYRYSHLSREVFSLVLAKMVCEFWLENMDEPYMVTDSIATVYSLITDTQGY